MGHELFLELTGNFIHACREVHRTIGFSLPQEAYKKALAFELAERKVTFAIDEPYDVEYRDQLVHQHRIDFVLDDKVLIQIVSVDGEIHNDLIGQMISARNVSGMDVALIVNFGNDKLQIRRLEKRKPEDEARLNNSRNNGNQGGYSDY
ncbi:MAG: GxxExxY protein [bacterium]